MSADRSYVEHNTRERERLRSLVERLTDDELLAAVNESWTVAGVMGHIAFWDARTIYLANKLEAGIPFSEDDDEPEDVDWINDSGRALIHAIPPREAARLALRMAEETDDIVASLSPERAARTWPTDPKSPLNPLRASHRGEHLDEIEAALGRRDA
jgi:DinB family protein